MNGDDMLEIDMCSKNGILFVRLFGYLTKNTKKKFNNDVLKPLVKISIKNVVFNLDNLSSIDDSGYKILVKCYRLCIKNEGMVLICLNKNKFNHDFSFAKIIKDELAALNINV